MATTLLSSCRSGLQRPVPRALKRPQSGSQTADSAVAAERVARRFDIGDRLFGGAKERTLLRQFILLPRAWIQPVEFSQPEAKLLFLAGGASGAGVQGLGCGLGSLERGPRLRNGAQRASRSGESVEQRPVGASVEQAHGLVLTMHLDQEGAEITQHADAGRLIVDEGPRAPVRRDMPAQDEVFGRIGRQTLGFQIVPGRMTRGQDEHGSGRRLSGAAAHQPPIGALARSQSQRVQHDRLAGARLAGKSGQPRPNLQVQGFDQHEVADG